MTSPALFRRSLRAAERHLRRADARLATVIEHAGPCTITRDDDFEPFAALTSAIAHQQLTGKAATTILGRVKAAFGDGDWPTPTTIARARLPSLRKCGLSNAKSLALKDAAAKTLDGTVPTARILHTLPDDDIVTRLTSVRGVGEWTVHMLLMFRLGRLDVLPTGDYGVRKGFTQLHRKRELVTPKALLAAGEAWRPYRSVAAWYLWRVLDTP